MQVILDSSFARPSSAPIWCGKKGEFRDWAIYILNETVRSVFILSAEAGSVPHQIGNNLLPNGRIPDQYGSSLLVSSSFDRVFRNDILELIITDYGNLIVINLSVL